MWTQRSMNARIFDNNMYTINWLTPILLLERAAVTTLQIRFITYKHDWCWCSSLLEAPALAKEKCCVCCLRNLFCRNTVITITVATSTMNGWVWWLMWWECSKICVYSTQDGVDKYVNDSWGERNGNPDGKEGGICSNINDSWRAINKAMLLK